MPVPPPLPTCNDNIPWLHRYVEQLSLSSSVGCLYILGESAKLQGAIKEVLQGVGAHGDLTIPDDHETTVTLYQE